jgi:hypothetical protein
MFGVVLYCLLAGQIAAFGKINITCFASGLVLTIEETIYSLTISEL